MQRPILETLPPEEQTAFNLKRWQELLADSELARELARIEGRIETDRHGNVIVMSPPPGIPHGSYQVEIGALLRAMLPNGRVISECPISTADGVRSADVAWASRESLAENGTAVCFVKAPEICVEVLSPSNTRREMKEKRSLYFAAGAQEVWVCDEGRMSFFTDPDSSDETASVLCPKFPKRIEL
jgi:Uma2 family endonuclease